MKEEEITHLKVDETMIINVGMNIQLQSTYTIQRHVAIFHTTNYRSFT